MNQLPPLNPLRAFEAAGRLKSIRKAADELSVTPGAVSRQVQILETHLGIPLFRRESRSAILTAAGEQYLAAITEHIDGIREATLKLTGERGRSREILKVRAYVTFAMKWLIPRLSSFHEANPSTEARITASLEAVDFEHEDVDGAIRLGDGHWPEYEVDRLVANELIPVCSPEFRRTTMLKHPSDLAGRTLLHSLARPDDWMYWLKAAGQTGIDAYAGLKYQSSVMVHQAAIEGQGIAIAQKVLVDDDLRRRRLVQPFKLSCDRGDFTYYLIYPKNRLRNPSFRKFRSWLVEQARLAPQSKRTDAPTSEGSAVNSNRGSS
ncbi:MAG: LysR family transcriptional regulator, glycine cleavage system transcriptional activator [Alphaproteobacteria bacterium]|jgi:LysR family glycine cleavage system transcriptional activator|nr:LysR family transcriptional regulator, glycine cleavage system transcriptional activator [Alphaproteobacteria bacterium]